MRLSIKFSFALLFFLLNLLLAGEPTTLVFPPYLHTYGIRKATRFHLFLFTKNRTKFNDPQGLAVVRLDVWEDTTTTHDDDEVTVYGVNSGENNIIYNKSMKSLGIYGPEESGERALDAPHGIAANRRGDVYVADTGNHRIVRLFNPGAELKYVTSIGKSDSQAEVFDQPYDVALDIRGTIYVTDFGNHRIQVYDSENNWVGKINHETNPGLHLRQPTGIAVIHPAEKWCFFRQGFLAVIDSGGKRLQTVALDGNPLHQTTAKKFGYPNANLQYPEIDYYGNVYVTDKAHHCIHKFDRMLNYLALFGSYGKGEREFIEPRGITIYRRFGQIFIAEAMGAQYYWIGVDVFDFQAEYIQQRNRLKMQFFLTEPAFVTADVYDQAGKWVTRFFKRRFFTTGFQTDWWKAKIYLTRLNGKGQNEIKSAFQKNQAFPAGKYRIKYTFEPTYSSYHYFSREFEKLVTILPEN